MSKCITAFMLSLAVLAASRLWNAISNTSGLAGNAHRCVAFHLRGHVAAGEAVNDNASLVAVISDHGVIGFLCWLFNSAWPVILVFLWLIL